MPDAFVAIDERMIRDQKKSERSSFFDDTWIQLFAAERLVRLSDR